MRKSIVAGNWKMYKTVREAEELASAILQGLAGLDAVETVLCPPFTSMKPVSDLISRTALRLGAQNVHPEPPGAYTGETSLEMLKDLSVKYVIVGHSERRAHFHETDEEVNKKARAVLDAGMSPIVCVGETLQQRETGDTEAVLRGQLEKGLAGLGADLSDAVLAYEPVWAIGTGRTATKEQAQSAHEFIRGIVASLAGPDVADAVRIQYGGSVKPANAAELFAQPDVDGGLIGGASLDAASFLGIVRAAA